MSTSTQEKILPANTTFLTTVTNLNRGNLITPSPQVTVTPLCPAVSVVENNGVLNVVATVFIDAADSLSSLNVYISNSLLNGNTQVIYFVYDYVEEVPQSLYPYTFTFQVTDPNNTISFIESILWDEDPVSSRGTVTTVLK